MKAVTILIILLFGTVFLNLLARGILSSQDTDNSGRAQRVLSNWYWVRGYGSWLEKDEPRLKDHYSFATALDPFNLTYWSLAAHTLAFDLPVWELNLRAAEDGNLKEKQIAAVRARFGEESLGFFERSRVYFEGDPDWYLTASILAETARNDPLLARQYLEEAVALPEFPYPVGRSYVRLLIEAGELDAAYSFMASWLPRLGADSFEARSSEIRNLLQSLESELDQTPPN